MTLLTTTQIPAQMWQLQIRLKVIRVAPCTDTAKIILTFLACSVTMIHDRNELLLHKTQCEIDLWLIKTSSRRKELVYVSESVTCLTHGQDVTYLMSFLMQWTSYPTDRSSCSNFLWQFQHTNVVRYRLSMSDSVCWCIEWFVHNDGTSRFVTR